MMVNKEFRPIINRILWNFVYFLDKFVRVLNPSFAAFPQFGSVKFQFNFRYSALLNKNNNTADNFGLQPN